MTAACLSSSQTAKEKAEIFSRLRFDKNDKKGDKNKAKSVVEPKSVQLLYVTPELIKTDKFRGVLHKLYESKRLLQIAIDEAHCVSTWGHDFRGAYKELSWLREAFPDVPIMACEFISLVRWKLPNDH
jgi:superfamily II DNA helicase RecQ